MSQVGRIGGQVLSDNLLRAGVDLAFETSLLYIDVNNSRIGIRDSTPSYTLDVNSNVIADNLTISSQITIDGIRLTAPDTIGSTLAPIDVFINGSMLFHDRLTTANLEFDDNFIGSFSNSNIVLDPNGTGTVEIFSTTNITGNVDVDGNISLPGNLQADGNLTFGDSTINNSDTVEIGPDIAQHIVPGDNLLYDLGTTAKRWRTGYVNAVDVTQGFTSGNITVSSPSTVSSSTGNITISMTGLDPASYFTGDIRTSGIKIDGNTIQSFTNQNIIFNPNGTGPIRLESTTNVTGNIRVSGNTVMIGDLSLQGTITIGDQTIDTVTIAPDFTQSIIPGDDWTYAMGADAGDSSPRRWAEAHIDDWTNITTGAWPGSGIRTPYITVSDQMVLNGNINKISGVQSNEDISIAPDTGITYIEKLKWETDYITNLLNTPVVITGSGRHYVKFDGTNGLVIPSGTDAERAPSPEIGETRWNTDQGYLECWDGTTWVVSIGAGPTVTVSNMEDYSNVWNLILG